MLEQYRKAILEHIEQYTKAVQQAGSLDDLEELDGLMDWKLLHLIYGCAWPGVPPFPSEAPRAPKVTSIDSEDK